MRSITFFSPYNHRAHSTTILSCRFCPVETRMQSVKCSAHSPNTSMISATKHCRLLQTVSLSAGTESGNDDECSSPLGGISLSNVAVSLLGGPPKSTVSHVDTSNSALTHASHLQSPVPLNASALSAFNQQLNSFGRCSRLPHDIHHRSPDHHTKQYQTAGHYLVSTDPSHQSTHSIFFSKHLLDRSLDNFHPRSLQVIASDKCHQLASALGSMATKVPYEDVQTAATSIAQCAMNALTVSYSHRLQARDRNHRPNIVVGGE